MKHTLLIALLGATVTLATPSLTFAHDSQSFMKHTHDKPRFIKKPTQKVSKPKSIIAKIPKPPKPSAILKQIHNKIHNTGKSRQQVVKRQNDVKRHNNVKRNNTVRSHSHNRSQFVNTQRNHQRNVQRNHRNDPSFSIAWNVGNATIAYTSDANVYGYDKRGHNKHSHRKQDLKRIYHRIHTQANLIQRGAQNGQLVKREVKQLRHEQRHIKNTLASYKRDGRVNRYESSKLNQLLDVANNNIHRKSTNRLTRYNKRNHGHSHTYAQF